MSKIQYNPWENKKTFVQNIVNTDSILDLISSEELDKCPSMPNFSNYSNGKNDGEIIKDDNNDNNIKHENDNKDSNNFILNEKSILPLITINEYSNTESLLEALEKLYEYNTIQYNKLEKLELIYEKYKYQNILNSHKNFELSQKLIDLSNFFQEIKQNKNKLIYLLHNSGMTDSHVIKIKHGKKIELIKTLKLCCNKNNPILDMIELYENMHENTLNKLKDKINKKEKKINELIKEFNDIQNIK